MILYQLRLALLSLRRTPLLSALIVMGIALGIGVSITFIAIRQLFAADPIPAKSDVLHYVRVDAWDPVKPFPGTEDTGAPPVAMTYMDAVALTKNDAATRVSPAYPARLFVRADPSQKSDEDPFRVSARLCYGDFFEMMDAPLAFGSGWTRAMDEAIEPVAVIGHDLNQRLFGGRDSVGEKLRVEDVDVTVVGVLAPWKPFLRYWEVINSPVAAPEEIYMPFSLGIRREWDNSGNDYGWGSGGGDSYENFLASESCWLGLWVELPDARAREAYAGFVDAYALQQKELGRFQRPLNNRVTPIRQLFAEYEIVPEELNTMAIVSLLFLGLCVLNVVGLLMGKFLARAPEVGTRRAMGASRLSIFFQHIVECELIGLLGGVLGVAAGAALLLWINRMPHGLEFDLFRLDVLWVVLLLSLGAGFLAGLYPAWRIATLEPAVYLKQA